jgi:hypothetical protein
MKFLNIIISILLTVLLTACRVSSSPQSSKTREPLECEVQGHPCNFAEVPVDHISQSLALSEQVAQQPNEGSSPAGC